MYTRRGDVLGDTSAVAYVTNTSPGSVEHMYVHSISNSHSHGNYIVIIVVSDMEHTVAMVIRKMAVSYPPPTQ